MSRFSVFLFAASGLLRPTICCKKFVPDVYVNESQFANSHWSLLHPHDTEHFDHRPVVNYANRQTNIEPRCTCGKSGGSGSEQRVIGGRSANKHEFPWQVALVPTNSRASICGGTLINSRFILTAAHCLIDTSGGLVYYAIRKQKNIQVLLNAHVLDSGGEYEAAIDRGKRKSPEEIARLDANDGTIRRNVQKIFVHDGYITALQIFQGNQIEDDIGLILLDRPVDMTGAQGPWSACLPETDTYKDYNGSSLGTISGWGFTKYKDSLSVAPALKKLEISIMNLETCKEIAADGSLIITHHFICIGSPVKGGRASADAAKGDSGGPLTEITNNSFGEQFIQIGITSFQNKISESNLHLSVSFSAYTRITGWIYSKIDEEIKRGTHIVWCKRN